MKVLLLTLMALALDISQARAVGQAAHILPLQFGNPVVGEPFSGTRTLDYEPAENSSDPVAVHAEEKFYRDSAGRTRSEIKYSDRLAIIDILDFGARVHYHWIAGDTVASRFAMKETDQAAGRPGEKLGEDAPIIEGVATRHSRSVKGTQGKINEIVESWYAPSLHLAMLTIIDRPGVGKTTYRYGHMNLGEPDAGLFRVPDNFTIEDRRTTPPPPVSVSTTGSHADSANSSAASTAQPIAGKGSLPHPVEDDNYIEALTRFHAAVPRWLPSAAGYHEHTDLRIIDINGVETKATLDGWHKGRLGRDEQRAPGWRSTIVWSAEQSWASHDGICPLRLCGLFDVTPRPGPMERRIRVLGQRDVKLRQRSTDGVLHSCSGSFGGAEICFDIGTGFPALATVDDERIVYEDWSQYRGAVYPSRWALYRGQRLQIEASVTVTGFDGPDSLFDPLADVAPRPNRLGAQLEDSPTILSRGAVKSSNFGQALVKVSVDANGRVKNAELLDADDSSLGQAALVAAKKTVYLPQEANGTRISFETGFRVDQWSTVDPMRVGATSLSSQGTD